MRLLHHVVVLVHPTFGSFFLDISLGCLSDSPHRVVTHSDGFVKRKALFVTCVVHHTEAMLVEFPGAIFNRTKPIGGPLCPTWLVKRYAVFLPIVVKGAKTLAIVLFLTILNRTKPIGGSPSLRPKCQAHWKTPSSPVVMHGAEARCVVFPVATVERAKPVGGRCSSLSWRQIHRGAVSLPLIMHGAQLL